MKETRKKADSGDHQVAKHVAAGTMPSTQSIAQQDAIGNPPAQFQSPGASDTPSERKRDNQNDVMTDKNSMPLWLQLIASISIPVIVAIFALVALINPQFAELRGIAIENRDAIAALDSKLSGEIAALDSRLTGEIAALDSKLSGEIAALDSRLTGEVSRLDNRITVEVTRLDDKFDALANLMIVALTNGGATEAELAAIWESVRNPE